jgi:4-carboxymuconolactone decarboxylase
VLSPPDDAATRALAGLSAAIAVRDPPTLAAAIDRVAAASAPAHVEEVLLQSHLFVGFPTALEAVAAWRERSGHDAPTDRGEGSIATWRGRGEDVCATVYGGQYGRLRENIARLHPLYERWMLEDGYGKVIGRPELGLAVRELCIVAQLAAHGAPRQLYSHLRGARNAGCDDSQIGAALAEAAAVTTEDRAREAEAVWASLRTRPGNGGR